MNVYTIKSGQDYVMGKAQTFYHVLKNGQLLRTCWLEKDAKAYVAKIEDWAASSAKILAFKKGIKQ